MERIRKFYQNIRLFLQKLYNRTPQTTYIEFSDFFRSEKLTNLFGFNILPRDIPLEGYKWRRTFFGLSMVNMALFLILNIASIVTGLVQGGSFLVCVENVTVGCIMSLILIKGFTIVYWHRERFVKIVEQLRKHYPHDAWNQHVFRAPRHLKTLKICGTICAVLCLTAMVEFVSMPFLIKLYGAIFSQETKWELIIQLQLPVDTAMPVTYAILYFINALALIVGTFTVLMTDLLFAELFAITNMELMALGWLISEIDPLEGQDEAIDELKKLCEAHQELTVISEELRDIFSSLLFIDCFGMMISMCCTAFLTLVIFKRLF